MRETETKTSATGTSGRKEPQSSNSKPASSNARLFANRPSFDPRNNPVRHDPSSAPATLSMVKHAVNQIMEGWKSEIVKQAKNCEDAKVAVAQTLQDVKLYNPEEVAVLQAENVRHLEQIKTLQFALHLSRKTTRELGVQGGAKFWKRLGKELVEDSAAIQQYSQELVEHIVILKLEGAESLVNLLNHLDSIAQNLEAFGQNAESYAFDHQVDENE